MAEANRRCGIAIGPEIVQKFRASGAECDIPFSLKPL
jgi:hypothetical protein